MIDIAHVHPMLVHFPIVLFLLAVAIDFFVLIRKGDLASKDCLPTIGLSALLLAALAAIAAATFGDIALDKAVELGFGKAPLEQHEELGLTTLWIMIGLAVWQVMARWRGMRLNASTGWIFFAISLVGTGTLLTAAYFGGELVYNLGVNVAPVQP
ncbi:hypothetical protein MNBD_GAMMA14-442 [hydrothermal vent metagenome]|uniref:DUF2231 domain-containing protein n=2 Tax=hydrothermal vent metagenome TaxID=652676 RepID=A0A3B0XXA3_9ZZZZ